MEEQDKRTEEQEDVEAHRTHPKPQASEDAPKDEGDGGDDFELHRTAHKAL